MQTSTWPPNVKHIFNQLRVAKPGTIGERKVAVVLGIRQKQSPVKLYLEQQSELLLREVRYVTTTLGNMPAQTDYGDYRDLKGVKNTFPLDAGTSRGAVCNPD